MKTWKPDTCECHVEERYDGSTIVGMGQVLRKCAAHASVPDDQLYDVILRQENQVKNLAARKLLEIAEGVVSERNEDGALVSKADVRIQHAFAGAGANRTLTLTVAGATLSPAHAQQLRQHCDLTWGAGKVTVGTA